MAISLEFINIIIPISIIRAKHPGGWRRCLARYSPFLGETVWHDDHLFREGAMNPMDSGKLVKHWEDLGFQTIETVDGNRIWKDICVVSMLDGLTLPCKWIDFDDEQYYAYLKGQTPGKVIGPYNHHNNKTNRL